MFGQANKSVICFCFFLFLIATSYDFEKESIFFLGASFLISAQKSSMFEAHTEPGNSAVNCKTSSVNSKSSLSPSVLGMCVMISSRALHAIVIRFLKNSLYRGYLWSRGRKFCSQLRKIVLSCVRYTGSIYSRIYYTETNGSFSL